MRSSRAERRRCGGRSGSSRIVIAVITSVWNTNAFARAKSRGGGDSFSTMKHMTRRAFFFFGHRSIVSHDTKNAGSPCFGTKTTTRHTSARAFERSHRARLRIPRRSSRTPLAEAFERRSRAASPAAARPRVVPVTARRLARPGTSRFSPTSTPSGTAERHEQPGQRHPRGGDGRELRAEPRWYASPRRFHRAMRANSIAPRAPARSPNPPAPRVVRAFRHSPRLRVPRLTRRVPLPGARDQKSSTTPSGSGWTSRRRRI